MRRVEHQLSFFYIEKKDRISLHRSLAEKFCSLQSENVDIDLVERAIKGANIGSAPQEKEMCWMVYESIYKYCPGKTSIQVARAQMVDAGFRYSRRYQRFETERDYRKFLRQWDEARRKALEQ